MDAVTLAVALSLAKKKVLPQSNPEDAGAMLVVDSSGEWAKGEPISATISVNGTTLVVTSE